MNCKASLGKLFQSEEQMNRVYSGGRRLYQEGDSHLDAKKVMNSMNDFVEHTLFQVQPPAPSDGI